MFVRGPDCPPGVNRMDGKLRMPVLRVVSGDTWTVDANVSFADGTPADPSNSEVEFVVSENQFSPPLWSGKWFSGVIPDLDRTGIAHVEMPRDVTKAFRRGSYMFSMRLSDRLGHSYRTVLSGNFLVEYMPTSDQHSIPYRDGTSEIFGSCASGSPSLTPSCAGSESAPLEGAEISTKTIDGIREAVGIIGRILGAKVDS